MTKNDIANTDIEVIVYIKAFDEVFSNNVMARTSYVSNEIVYGARFRIMYHPSDDKSRTILHVDQINSYDLVPLPEPVISSSN